MTRQLTINDKPSAVDLDASPILPGGSHGPLLYYEPVVKNCTINARKTPVFPGVIDGTKQIFKQS